MAHPFYPTGNPRFNHVAMSLPADLLGAESRSDLCRFFHEVLGFEEMEVMTEDRRRLILSCVHWDQFIFLIAEDDPMRCPRMDHYGFAVGSLDELKGIRDRAEEFRKTDDRHGADRPAHGRPEGGQDPLALRPLHPADDLRVPVLGVPRAGEPQQAEPTARSVGRRRYGAVMAPPTTAGPANGRAELFRSLHVPGTPLLMPNAWDVGSARLFAELGFEALATTSGGFAATRGRADGMMERDEVLTHSGELAGAVDVPVSGDLENCFADDPEGVAATIAAAAAAGLAGGSVEDFTKRAGDPIYERAHAAERVRAASEAAHRVPGGFVLTARAENYLHGRVDLADTITRLQAYQEAGADVLFAPRVVEPAELRTLVAAVDVPVSVLVGAGRPDGRRAGRPRGEPHLGRWSHRGRRLRRGDQGRHRTTRSGHDRLLGPGRGGSSRHERRLQSLSATVTSISTAPFRGSAATPMAERVWRPASPNTSASTRLAPSTTVGCSWKSGADAT